MSVKELTTILLIALADMASTYSLMITHSTCSLEKNPFLRSLCNEIGYGATWIWLPIEFSTIATVYVFLKKLRIRFRALIDVEKMFLVLTIVPIVNNIINLLRTL
jgi:hypothetical protein